MKLQFSGSPTIAASRYRVWQRLIDPHFVAQSAPGVESVQTLGPAHFKAISGFGAGPLKLRFVLDVRLFDILAERSAKMRIRASGPGSAIEVISSIEIGEAGPATSRLNWTATTEVNGTVAKLGARLMEGTARRLTEQFWADFARRVSQER